MTVNIWDLNAKISKQDFSKQLISVDFTVWIQYTDSNQS